MIQIDKQKDIANTILQQIKYADKWALAAYGARNFIPLPECKIFQGGLKFQCNGLRHRGTVVIQLKWIDTYTISFLSMNGKVEKVVKDTYCDELVSVLDYIEGK
jgi:hypothetical protein